MQITILGQLAVDGRPVRGERLATVIRELVEARGRAVTTTALVEAVWDGTPPDDAVGAVQALVSRVRRLGLPVVAVPGGYRVPGDEVRVDAVEARALVERSRQAGDPVEARRWSDAARALFPEIPELADAGSTRLFADIAALRAQAALAGAGDRGAADHGEADLRRLVAHTPPDEPSAALLVRVLAAQGREAEALEVVEQLRTELAERYGTDPSPVVTQAHLALLRGELPGGGRPEPEPPRRQAVAALPAAWRRSSTALVGREDDVTAVLATLADAQLVTVVAMGGAGKTRLAAEVARRTAAAGRSVRVVELASLRSPDEVLPAMLAAIGGAEQLTSDRRQQAPEERFRAVAQDLDGLVVVDNCEHLLEAVAAVVAELLGEASPQLTVLATSRAPLSLLGEVVHRLPILSDDAALGLLAARARAGGAAFIPDPDRALELCHRLDNLPLALELAAARLRHMPVDDVLAGLTNRFALLDDALRGLPDRHASLWAMVDWSRELLAPEDRDLLQRLAVVPAPFTARTAAGVLGGADVRSGLATLVEQSLLAVEDGDGEPPRYRMLETVREYGDVRLDAAGGRDTAMAGLVGWARTEAVALFADFTGPGQITAFRRCALEQHNLVAALRWSITHDDEAAAVDVAVALFHLWTAHGLHLEVIGWARELLHIDDPLARRDSAILHGRASSRSQPHADRLAWVCLLIGLNGGVAESSRLFVLARRGLRTLFAERPGEVTPRATAFASALPAIGSPDPTPSLEATTALIADPDPWVQSFGLLLRSMARENYGMVTASIEDAEQAYSRFESIGDHWGMGMAAQGLGDRIGTRDPAAADEWLRRGVRHLALVGAVQDVASLRVQLDIQLAFGGDQDAVRRLAGIATSADVTEMDIALAHLGLAQLMVAQERYEEVLAHTDVVTAIAAGPGMPIPQVRVLVRIAVAVLDLRLAAAGTAPGAGAAEARAVALLTLARAEAQSSRDIPVLGSWALGGAALAAHHGDAECALSLWTLGVRLGANLRYLFRQGYGERLTAALGEEEDREPLLAAWRERPVTEAGTRLGELMDELLAQTFVR